MAIKIVIGVLLTLIFNKVLFKYLRNLNVNHKAVNIMYILIPLLILVTIKSTLYPLNFRLIAYVWFMVLLAYIALIDFYTKLIPNKLLRVQLAGVVFFSCIEIIAKSNFSLQFIKAKLITLLLTGGSFFIVYIVTKASIGAGDVKLMIIFGLTFSQSIAIAGLFYAVICSAVVGIALILLKRLKIKDDVPFAPFVFIGTMISIIQLG